MKNKQMISGNQRKPEWCAWVKGNQRLNALTGLRSAVCILTALMHLQPDTRQLLWLPIARLLQIIICLKGDYPLFHSWSCTSVRTLVETAFARVKPGLWWAPLWDAQATLWHDWWLPMREVHGTFTSCLRSHIIWVSPGSLQKQNW